MKPFEFRPAQGPWSTGETWLFFCAVPDLARDTALAELFRGCREAMDGFPIAPVPDETLRVTLAQVGDAPAGQIDQAQRAALLQAVRSRLSTVEPFSITAGSPLAYATGALCDLEDEPLQQLIGLIRSAVRELRGAEADTFHPGVTHLTLGYAHAEASTDDLARRLRRVRPSHARMHIDAVHLLEVGTDPQARVFRLNPVGVVPLSGA
ncbi:2'-5' RNA ligase family protein [Kineosporia rhizophila]|uniref:2'-5' RNA ligase family protein n=1 Tax=Kineosporia rhizophila TaxID=84633 RepID=UPI001E357619|nr:2'-5' RNA ligase family protein [Kineosporia rhizophila]